VSLTDWLSELYRRDQTLARTGTAMFVLLAVFALLALVDTRTILGISPWIKPMKFAVSLGIFLWTLAWFMAEVRPDRLRLAAIVRYVVVITLVGEIVLIALQSARGTSSHFNVGSFIDARIFNLMGIMITVHTVAIAAWLTTLRSAPADRAGYSTGIRLGTVIFILGSVQGFVMATRLGHAVPGPDGGPGLPFLNWSTTGGDLRVAHFIGLHAFQALPLLGYMLDVRRVGTSMLRRAIVATAGAVWLGVAVAALLQALAGRTLLGG
jgi:hypothetical protein